MNETEELTPVVLQLALGMMAFTIATMGSVFWIVHSVAKTKIGVIGKSLVLESSRNRTIARAENLFYTNGHLMADNVVIAIGGPQQRFFDRKQLEDYVFPRLKNATRLRQLAMMKHLWRLRDPQFMASMIILVLAVLACLLLQFALPPV